MNFQAFVTPPGLYQEGNVVIGWDGMGRSTYEFETAEAATQAVQQFNTLVQHPPLAKVVNLGRRVDAIDGKTIYHLWFSKEVMSWHLCQPTQNPEQLKGLLEPAGYQCMACCGWGCCECSHWGYF